MFEIQAGQSIITNGKPIYRNHENSFDFIDDKEQFRRDGVLTVATLQIPLAISTGFLGGIFGYEPRTRWQPKVLSTPISNRDCTLRYFVSDLKLIPEFAVTIVPLIKELLWTCFYDVNSGWFLTRHPKLDISPDFVCEFATNTLAEIYHNSLVGLWIKPEIID